MQVREPVAGGVDPQAPGPVPGQDSRHERAARRDDAETRDPRSEARHRLQRGGGGGREQQEQRREPGHPETVQDHPVAPLEKHGQSEGAQEQRRRPQPRSRQAEGEKPQEEPESDRRGQRPVVAEPRREGREPSPGVDPPVVQRRVPAGARLGVVSVRQPVAEVPQPEEEERHEGVRHRRCELRGFGDPPPPSPSGTIEEPRERQRAGHKRGLRAHERREAEPEGRAPPVAALHLLDLGAQGQQEQQGVGHGFEPADAPVGEPRVGGEKRRRGDIDGAGPVAPAHPGRHGGKNEDGRQSRERRQERGHDGQGQSGRRERDQEEGPEEAAHPLHPLAGVEGEALPVRQVRGVAVHDEGVVHLVDGQPGEPGGDREDRRDAPDRWRNRRPPPGRRHHSAGRPPPRSKTLTTPYSASSVITGSAPHWPCARRKRAPGSISRRMVSNSRGSE